MSTRRRTELANDCAAALEARKWARITGTRLGEWKACKAASTSRRRACAGCDGRRLASLPFLEPCAAVEVRASLLLNAAAIIRERKLEFAAWLTYEVGKNWAEADADVAETIDFMEFYAREALRLSHATTPIQLPGERNRLLYIPLGVGAVIPPWNFPFAIMAGMTAAAVVTGNTVVLKPSSDSPTIAALFMEVLEEAGMPAGVVNFCPGSGATFGNAIVEHPKTRFIAFTGSKSVGLDIHERAAKTHKGQIWIKRTVLEMGGKDSILVCADADVDAAADGVVAAAFGFSGQKCSACSRAIIEAPIYDAFVEKVRERVARLTVGDPVENNNLGPVVNASALQSILEYIEKGKQEGRLVAGGSAVLHLSPKAISFSQRSLLISIRKRLSLRKKFSGPFWHSSRLRATKRAWL